MMIDPEATTPQLRALRAEKFNAMQTLLAGIRTRQGRGRAAGGLMTPQQSAELKAAIDAFEAMESELEEIDARIANQKDASPQVDAQPRVADPMPIYSGEFAPPGQTRSHALSVGRTFNAMFPRAPKHDAGRFADLGQFAQAVYQRHPSLFANSSGMSEGVGGDGGFFVPIQFYSGLMDASLQQEAIRPGATIVPMASSSVSIPMFDLSNRSTGVATLEGKATAEGATASTQKAKAREIQMSAKKVVVLVPTTVELLQDAPQLFGSLLQTAMTDALSQTLDSWFISGNGAGAPLGILNAPALVSVAKDGSQVAATITPTNLAGMVSRLAPGSWKRAVWIVSPSALAQLFTIKTTIMNVAGTENVGGFGPNWFTTNADGSFTLLGRPLIVSDRCQALGTKGDVLLVDRSSYLVGLRQDATLAVDNSIGFKESEVWFRLSCRIDGQPALASAITPRVGSATLSPFVSLDTRS